MDGLLANAVENGDIETVKRLIELGVNTNLISKGKSVLSVAASHGDLATMELLLSTATQPSPAELSSLANKNRRGSNSKRKREKAVGNNGYYVVVHGEDGCSPCETPESHEEMACEQSSVKPNNPDETTTPEGMEKLEWDTELDASEPQEQVNKFQEKEDIWSSQYRWYAKILASTSQHMLYNPITSLNCDVNMQDQMGRCAMHYAADAGHLAAVKLLLKSGCKVDITDLDSLSPLHLAANRGAVSVVEELLNHGATVDMRSTDKMTPLHYACSRGHTEVVKALIGAKANLDALDSGDRTPLHLAASRDIEQVVKLLVGAGAKVNIEDVKGCTALCEAVWHKNVPMTQLLLDCGAKLTPTPYLLHYAILHRHKEMVEVLLNAGAIVNIRDDRGSTPLIVAVNTAQPEVIRLLLEFGAQVDFCGGLSWKTPLMTAVERTSGAPVLRVLKELIHGGADINKSCWSVNPITSAVLLDKVDAAVMLLAYGATLQLEDEVMPDAMFFARRSNNGLFAARAIVLVGYDLFKCVDILYNREAINETSEEISRGTVTTDKWLLWQKFNPLRLQDLTRILVRKLKPKNELMPNYAASLGLPPLLVHFIMLSDVRRIPGINCDDKMIESCNRCHKNQVFLTEL